ncbi:MAG: TIR domain-containing protein [Candidatus Competibacteraceae bacterium]
MSSPPRHKVFISYSHRDSQWLERLQVHLKPLERKGLVERWDDTRIAPGSNWQEEIRQALAATKVAVLLISADFLASDFIAEHELPPLLEAAERDGAVILPVIISPCLFQETPELSRFQAVNNPARPLVDLPPGEREQTFLKIARTILGKFPEEVGRRRFNTRLISLLFLSILAGAVLYLLLNGPAEQVLAGSIRDEANEPVAGVMVALPALGISATTDAFGHFQLRIGKALHQAQVELLARKDGYQTSEQYATLGNTQLSFTLRKKK